jgi:signal transduction histidine kinase
MRTFMRGEVPRKALLLLDDCVSDAVRFFAATQQGNVRVETRLASQQRIEADGAQLQQIVINLLQNAAEASPSGGVVTVETRDEPGAVVLAVVDRGTGIAPELKARMFEAFVTTKPRGSGLGLTIVRRLAEVHAASIQVDSARGAGTRFELRFRAR